MEKERLFEMLRYLDEDDRDEIGMIISNNIDLIHEGNGCVSVDSFDSLIDDIIKWKSMKELNNDRR